MYSVKSIKGLLLAGMIGLTGLLAGCGGGGAGGGTTTPTTPTTTTTTTLTGTAATGAAMPAGTVVSVKDATGKDVTLRSSTFSGGTFTLSFDNATTYTAPFILRADPTPANSNSGDEHYSILLSADTASSNSYRVNITPITSLALYEATKSNLASWFANLVTYGVPSSTELVAASAIVTDSNHFPAFAGIDLFAQYFSANGVDAYDAAMDSLDLVRIEFSGNTPTLRNSTNAVIAYDATTPLYPITSMVVAAGNATQVADGASYNLITATVSNAQPGLAKGVTVNFSTTAGTIYNSSKTAVVSSAVTDTTGVARVYLKSGFIAGGVSVRAESSDNAASNTAAVTFIPGAPAAAGLSAAPSSVAPGGTITLTAVVTDANGNLVADGETVNFTVSSTSGGALGGTFGGAPIADRTTLNGFITVQYTAGNAAGTENIKARTPNGSERTLALTISAAAPTITSVTLTSASTSLVANGTSSTTLTATARDSSGNGVPGAMVAFSTSAGTLNSAAGVTNASGVATVTLTSSAQVLTAVASASVNGIIATRNVNFTAGSAASIGINAAPNAVKPGGTSVITAAVVDSNGNPVANEPVSLAFTATGSGTPSLSALSGTTNANGYLVVTYTAGASNGTDTIRALTSNAFSSSTSISVNGSNAVVGSITAIATTPSIQVSSGSTVIRATVRDNGNQVVSGVTVTFTTSAGGFAGAGSTTAVTDANGIAQVTLSAGSQVLSALVEATVGGFSSSLSVSFTAGPANMVSVSAAPSSVKPGGTSVVSVYVVDASLNPVVGETVSFSISTQASGLPSLAMASGITNVNGIATVAYTAGAGTGNDVVRATTSNGNTSTVTVNVNPANAVVGSVTVSPVSASIPVTGSTVIRATVRDINNQLLPGVTVTFNGGSGGTLNVASATTDANGVAQATLTAGANIMTATVYGAASGVIGSTQVNFTAGTASTVSVSPSPNAVQRGGTSTVTVAVVDGNGNPVAGEPVALSLPTRGSGLSSLNVSSGTTNANGLLVVVYTAGAADGTDNVKAIASTGASGNANITVNASNAVVSTVSVAAGSASIPVSTSTSVNATVLDSTGQPLSGVSVTFSSTGGTITPAATATTNASGIATVTLTAGANIQAANVRATASNVSGTTTVNFTAGAASTVGVNASPNAVKPAGTSIITMAVVDSNGNAVAGETVSLTFDSRGSGVPSLSTVSGTTDVNGLLAVTYTAGQGTGSDVLRARTATGATSTVSIGVNPSNTVIGSISVVASNGAIPVSSGTSVIRATVKDSAGLLVPGVTVTFAKTAGSLSAASAVTDANGVATTTLTAGSAILTARVDATIFGFTSSTMVSFTAGAPAIVALSAAPSTVNPGVSSTIYAYVVDANQNPVSGETVTFSLPTMGSGLPTLTMTSAVTNQSGLASVTYMAGAGTGTDTIGATTSNGNVDTVNITVNASATVVGSITLISGATTLPADGASTAILRATVLTSAGAPASGVTVNFLTSGGSLSAASAVTNASGIAEVTLTSPTRTGTITVTANASGFVASQDLTVVAGLPDTNKFVLVASLGTVSAGGVSTLSAIVLDANDNPVVGQTVTFTITTNNTNGSLAPATAITSSSGIATTSYTGGNTLGTDTIRAALVGGLFKTTTVTVSGGTLNALAIGTSQTTVTSDNSETATITVTALSSQSVVVPGVTVTFSANGGELSAAQGVTDAAGKATVVFSAGTQNKSNRTVTITASATGATQVQIPVLVVDSTAELTTISGTLTAGGGNTTVTVTARDASGLGVYNIPVTLAQSGTGALTVTAASGNTDVNGQFTTTVSGLTAGSVTLTATALGASASQAFTVLPGSSFGITAPASDPYSLATGVGLVFTVTAPAPANRVRFASTIGTWSACPGGTTGSSVCIATTAAESATATLSSANTGIASVQVDGLDASGNVTGTDTHTVAITSAVAASISLQASAANVQPSTGGTSNTVTLIATLRDAGGQPVGNVPVAFSLANTTGGGESVSPVIKLSSDGVTSTDPLGQARAVFTSGSLPSGQTTSSVQVTATAVGSAAPPASVNIVIGGTAGSVVIGQATHITDSGSVTQYTYPMSVLVADSNGNPVTAGTVVSLSVWPTSYSKGNWVDAGTSATDGLECAISIASTAANEDANENLVLDATEDANADGSLTPGNSTGGTLPSSVVTDANGVANFNLIYLKSYAGWITVRISASTQVQGSEATSQVVFRLPWLKSDSDACLLSPSPFN